tara:strand:+ start:111 stop:1109 length:999 start_codon:yes stop_codon:yes gene_type:complete
MIFFTFFTKILHYLPSEFSHFIALKSLKLLYKIGILRVLVGKNQNTTLPASSSFTGLKNNLGIAAGLDKDGEYIDSLAELGFGFIEVGTVTPKPQFGNPKPRIFRDINNKSLLNRLGFNNKGVDNLVTNLKNRKSNIIVGSSIGKNFDTPNEEASNDYLYCIEKVYEYSDYIAINISSPNTFGLRELTNEEYLDKLLKCLKNKQNDLSKIHGYKPIFIKISPDESSDSLEDICNSIIKNQIDGIICSNTTIDHNDQNGAGGLSGKPLMEKATKCLSKTRRLIGNKMPIIASGGVMTADDYLEKIDAGANLVQIYTGFIYEGPKLIDEILNLN